MSGSWQQHELPYLTDANCRITSPATNDYNCIAWAAGSDDQWWDPHGLYYWPPDVPRDVTLPAVVQVYTDLGFEICVGGMLEGGFEKIAIFARQEGNKQIPTHAARQLDSGEWTSKLGSLEDITHSTVDDVRGPCYGEVAIFLSRRKRHQP